MKNKVKISISLICAFVFVFLLFFGNFQQNKKSQEIAERIEKIKVLEEDKAALERKIELLSKEYNTKLKEKATAQILFTIPKSKIYKDFFPKMKEDNISGIIALSPSMFIGDKGCITKAQFTDMIDSGWEYALVWDGKEDFNSFIKNAKDEFFKERITMPSIIYFEPKTYSKKYDKALEKYGFKTVIHNGEDGRAIIADRVSKPVWYIGSASILSESPKINIDIVIKKRGSIVYTVDFSLDEREGYTDFIISLIKDFKSHEKKLPFLLTTIDEAKKVHTDLSKSDIKLTNEYRKMVDSIYKEIEIKDKQMHDIFYGGNK